MNSCKEFEGKNVEKAIELACEELNITKNNLKYDIISSGTTGIFSLIGKKKAKIRVNIDNAVKSKQRVLSLVDEAFGVKKPRFDKKEQTPKEPVELKAKKESRPADVKKTDTKLTKAPVIEKLNMIDVDEEPTEKIISDFYQGKSSEVIGEEVLRKILEYVAGAFEITVEADEESLTFHISSDDSAVIIGKRGQSLEAIQYIVDKIVNKHTLDRRRVLIDVEGYLEKRRENLEKMAIRMSDKVNKTGKPSTISQMSSQDRRIVHLALKDNKTVRTQSMGEGYYRRLVIFPRKARSRKKPE
jgi:spoIIIJ-associated protein